jgi:hypothetical protein
MSAHQRPTAGRQGYYPASETREYLACPKCRHLAWRDPDSDPPTWTCIHGSTCHGTHQELVDGELTIVRHGPFTFRDRTPDDPERRADPRTLRG